MVKSKTYGITHAYAQCGNCDWNEGIELTTRNRMQKLRNKIYSHVEKTGHKVRLETGRSTTYYKEK